MTVTMRWYNPTCRDVEEVPALMSEAQALQRFAVKLNHNTVSTP